MQYFQYYSIPKIEKEAYLETSFSTSNLPKPVLIVEDDPQISRSLKLNLRLSGYDVAEASSVSEAWSTLEKNHFDIVYSQEVIYTIKDLKKHSKEIFNSLKCGGYYFATIGSHIENPLWSKRRELIRKEEQYYAYDYSIDEIANIFYKAGFRVGIKSLPLIYFSIYDKKITKSFSNSLSSLLKTTQENKMLFCFMKPCKK